MLSIFDIFKVGLGPSSSHTNGPMIAAYRFIQEIVNAKVAFNQLRVELYGSLSLTGIGHHTDKACVFGLMGFMPDKIDIKKANQLLTETKEYEKLLINGSHYIEFNYSKDIVFMQQSLPLHENALTFRAYQNEIEVFSVTYYSVGGGFVYTEHELNDSKNNNKTEVPFEFTNASMLLSLASKYNKPLYEIIYENEQCFHSTSEIKAKANKIWQVICECVDRGIHKDGVLSGGLNVKRRAYKLHQHLSQQKEQDELAVMDWVNLYAFAVSEENADGGQVVTSPTNGAAGVIPSVLMYFNKFVSPLDEQKILQFLLVAGAVGYLYKINASISGAEVGCQGEIGVSSSMAAAGLASLNGASNEQICIAAEIAMEHSLGMTCDPIGGLVQVPCIERNAMGALKAINAARMAIQRNEKTIVSLDNVIETMYKTGKDMNQKYRETSLGGLAIINLTPCE
ncbi:L-serine ammonia-lyase [Thorsellia kenyensis]|uniref:L-serine dehydratase n=1 Tax=Thorsellia kenyensis TaxID=1549888 RepID=A0ABV6C6A8_9GAMM